MSGTEEKPEMTASAFAIEPAKKLVEQLFDPTQCEGAAERRQVSEFVIATALMAFTAHLQSELRELRNENEKVKSARSYTHDWYAQHYGKLHDWARTRLPEKWVDELFSCIANGTWGNGDVGEPYDSKVGKIIPSGYFRLDTASEQILHDQSERAEHAEAELRDAKQLLIAEIEKTSRLERELVAEKARYAIGGDVFESQRNTLILHQGMELQYIQRAEAVEQRLMQTKAELKAARERIRELEGSGQ